MGASTFGVTDVLALGSDWEPQAINPASAATLAEEPGPDGDVVAETAYNEIESGDAEYIYIGAETGFAAALAADSCDVGDVVATGTLLITKVAIDYSPCAQGKRPKVKFSFRQGPTAAGPTYVTDLTLPTYVAATPTVPAILTATAGDAELQTSNWELAMQFGEDLDKDGAFLAGNGYGGRETVNHGWLGDPTSITYTGWQRTTGPSILAGQAKSNTGYGKTAYTFTRGVTRSA